MSTFIANEVVGFNFIVYFSICYLRFYENIIGLQYVNDDIINVCIKFFKFVCHLSLL